MNPSNRACTRWHGDVMECAGRTWLPNVVVPPKRWPGISRPSPPARRCNCPRPVTISRSSKIAERTGPGPVHDPHLSRSRFRQHPTAQMTCSMLILRTIDVSRIRRGPPHGAFPGQLHLELERHLARRAGIAAADPRRTRACSSSAAPHPPDRLCHHPRWSALRSSDDSAAILSPSAHGGPQSFGVRGFVISADVPGRSRERRTWTFLPGELVELLVECVCV